jgi:hypothetical protein
MSCNNSNNVLISTVMKIVMCNNSNNGNINV